MQLTGAEQELARTQPQESRLYLSIFQPSTVMQCQVNNGSAAVGDRVIPYDGVTYGAFGSVESGMTLLIGTTPGGRDIGRIRIRDVNASQFTVSENNNIAWADDLYLTVLKYWELWPIYTRIIHDPADPLNVIFYKDYDIAYTNQNSLFGTIPNAGPHRATFVDDASGIGQVYYTATGTFSILGVGLTYAWEFEGGNPATSAAATPGWVLYTGTGDYVTKLTITDANGVVDKTYRYIMIRNRPDKGPNAPISKWIFNSLEGSRGEGGYTMSISVFQDVVVNDNAVIVIFSEDWYGATKQSLGGNYPNAGGIFFVGHVKKDSIQYDYAHSLVTFDVQSITELMKDSIGFSVSCQADANPDTWYKILDLDTNRAIYHYLKWHTTVMMMSDFQIKGQNQRIQYFDSDRASMYDAIDTLMRGTLVGGVVADRQGKIWAEVDAQAYSNPTGSFPAALQISKRDWKGMPTVDELQSDEYSYVERGGIAYSGIGTGSYAALLACAPGDAPSFRGRTDTQPGLAVTGQAQLNAIVGNIWANQNTRYPKISMEMTENLRNLDIAPQETSQIVINREDTVRGAEINGLYLPAGMSWRYDPVVGLLLPSIDWQAVVSGRVGQTIIIPVTLDQGSEGGFSVPGLQIPPLATFEFPGISGGILPTGTATGTAAYTAMDYIDIVMDNTVTPIASASHQRGSWGAVTADAQGAYVQINTTGLYLIMGAIQVKAMQDTGKYFHVSDYPPGGASAAWDWFDDGSGAIMGIGNITTSDYHSDTPWDAMVRRGSQHGADDNPAVSSQHVCQASAPDILGMFVDVSNEFLSGRFVVVRLSD